MPSAEEQTELLARRLGAIVDASMRTAYVRHTLLAMSPPDVADLLIVARAHAEARSPKFASLLSSLSLALADESCTALRHSVAALLSAREQHAVARSLVPGAPTDGDAELRVPDFGLGRPVSLGERKSLARRRDRELITRVLRDPSPDVIRILLGNPALTEADVLVLCALRPVASEVLREVFRCQRWMVRHPIRVALILNPYSPVDIALQIAPMLLEQDLRRVLEAADLPDEVRAACRRRAEPSSLH